VLGVGRAEGIAAAVRVDPRGPSGRSGATE
jgi:hypothetical protein